MFEVEQKFRVDDPAEIESRLQELGATFGEPLEQVDCYFAHPVRDFAETDEALRIRRVGERNFITYKGPKIDRTTKTRREIELPLPPGRDYADRFSELLQTVAFTPVAVVRKTRRGGVLAFDGQQFEVAIDHVDRLGDFLELEITADESQIDDTRRCLRVLVDTLELTESERRSYLELLLESGATEAPTT